MMTLLLALQEVLNQPIHFCRPLHHVTCHRLSAPLGDRSAVPPRVDRDSDSFSVVDSSGDEVWSACEHELTDSEDEPEVEDAVVKRPVGRDPFFDFGALEYAVEPTEEEIAEDLEKLEVERAGVIRRGGCVAEWMDRVLSRCGHEVIDAVGDDLPPGMEIVGSGEWVRIKGGMTLDSGCSVFVMPSKWLRHLTLEPSEGSMRKPPQSFTAASNHKVVNEGQRTVRFRTEDGSRRQMIFQVAAVNKILASIAGICDNGNTVVFRQDGGTITHMESGRETHFKRKGNVYVMDMWIRNPMYLNVKGKSEPFVRHGRGQ